jgi:hypothetical protein
MTDTPVTTGEQVAETLHRLGYLIGQHDLPAPRETRVRPVTEWRRGQRLTVVHADVRLADLHELSRWAELTHAAITQVPKRSDGLHVACTVLGDVPLRMTAFGKALTP